MTNVHKQWMAMLCSIEGNHGVSIYTQCKKCLKIHNTHILNLVKQFNVYKKYSISRIISYYNVSHWLSIKYFIVLGGSFLLSKYL